MAKRASIDEGEQSSDETSRFDPDPDALRQAIETINSHKRNAAEASGEAGKATSEAVKNFGCEKNALTFTARLAAMEPSKRNSVVNNFIAFAIRMGWLDEVDMFLREDLTELLNRTDNGPPVQH